MIDGILVSAGGGVPLGGGQLESSLLRASDKSPANGVGSSMRCRWCTEFFRFRHGNAKYCSQKCRQTAFRLNCKLDIAEADGEQKSVAYADPPYPGMAKKFYGDQPNYAGEVNHQELIASLADRYDGWALSTSASALREVLPLCPEDARVCAWVKPIGANSKTRGLHNTWEPLIVFPCRRLRPKKRDWLSAQPARGGGDLMGRKPIAFAAFLFAALGLQPCDDFADLFPGSGVISRAWAEFRRTENTQNKQ